MDSHAAATAFYALLGVACAVKLTSTLSAQPLFAFATDDIEWVRAWLWMTVADYYGAALPLCGIAIASQPGLEGWLWAVGFCLLGSPVCCAYVVLRLKNYGLDGLRLVA